MLLSFLISLVLFLTIMVSLSYLGFRRSVTGWSLEKGKSIESWLEEELKSSYTGGVLSMDNRLRTQLDTTIPHGTTLIIYDKDMRQVYGRLRSHGKGRRWMGNEATMQRPAEDLPLHQVREGRETIAYFRIGSVSFSMDRANTRFLESMRKTVWLSMVVAFALALLFSLLLSRGIAASARNVANGIRRIAGGDRTTRVDSKGPQEIAAIAESANELGRKLEREEALRSQWAADIAHDLRTPLSALRSQLEGMADGVLDLSRERVQRNLTQLQRIEVLVTDLGELTRLESPEIRIRPITIKTEELAKELQDRFAGHCEKKGVKLLWKNDIETLTGDENLIQRAVSNFLENAVRHTQEGGTIHVSIGKEGELALVTVANTGRGIPENELHRVFDRLYRGEYSRSSPGSGLGLTIAKKIAQLHGGNVCITSSEDGPTTVEMLIPQAV